jgi:hypothetical protein
MILKHPMLRSSIIFLFLFGYANFSFSQVKVYFRTQKTDTGFVISPKNKIQNIRFYFPPLNTVSKELYQCYLINSPSWMTLERKSDTTHLNDFFQGRVFCENIKKVRFLFQGNGDSVLIECPIPRDGYQLPLTYHSNHLNDILNSNNTFQVSFDLADSSRLFKFLIGEVIIGNVSAEEKISLSKPFLQAPFDNERLEKYPGTPFNSNGLFSHFPKGQIDEDFKGILSIEDDKDSTGELLSKIFVPLLKSYPFYKVKHLNKYRILANAAEEAHTYTKLSLCQYVDSLNKFIFTKLHDPHFYIRSNCNENNIDLRTPIYSYFLKNHYLVAAVLDSDLTNSVPLGAEIISIDGAKLKGFSSFKDLDVNSLLKKPKDSTVVLILKLPNGEMTKVSYKIKSKYEISGKYKPSHLLFKYLNDSVAYFKINKIDGQLPLSFFSKLDSINTKRKLIIDLRNNSGGDFMAGGQFLSYLIKTSFKYFDFENTYTGILDSVVVSSKASPVHYRSDGKIIILVDGSTACIAELIAYSLRANRENVQIVGTHPTKGALSFAYEIQLPRDNITVVTNCMDTGRFLFNGKSIEDKGINPHPRVVINNISDLQPYNDKVLQTAILL